MTSFQITDEEGFQVLPTGGLQFALIDVAADQTDASVVAAVSGSQIRVVSYLFVVGATATVLFESGNSTALTGVMPFAANGIGSFSGSALAPAFETASGAALTLTNVGAGGDVRGHLCYLTV